MSKDTCLQYLHDSQMTLCGGGGGELLQADIEERNQCFQIKTADKWPYKMK